MYNHAHSSSSRYFKSAIYHYSNLIEMIKLLNENINANDEDFIKLKKQIDKEIGPIGRKINENSYRNFHNLENILNLNEVESKHIEPNEIFKINARIPNHRYYILYLYSRLKNICMVYFHNHKYEKSHAFGVTEDDYNLWKNTRCVNYMEDLKSTSDIMSMLEKFKPNYIMLSSCLEELFDEASDTFENQFGMLLFDEFGNALSKAIFKFYDKSNAPKNALELDVEKLCESLSSPPMIDPPFLVPEDI